MDNFKVISLFSGAGGMDLGFKNAGFNIIWANDINNDAVETYKYNINNNIVCADVKSIDENFIAPTQKDIDVIIGGFPCQGFSISNYKRSIDDERNDLYLEILRVVKNIKPKFIVLENVDGIINLEYGTVLNLIIEDFKNIGYEIDYKILNAADFGVPQERKRVIIIGNNQGLENIFPSPSYSSTSNCIFDKSLPYVNVSDSIGYLVDIPVTKNINDIITENNTLIYNHSSYDTYKSSNTFNQATLESRWDSPSRTILATLPPIHSKIKTRRLSARECAILQTFPDDFIFLGSLSSVYSQIGNAVPVMLAEKIALEVKKQLYQTF